MTLTPVSSSPCMVSFTKTNPEHSSLTNDPVGIAVLTLSSKCLSLSFIDKWATLTAVGFVGLERVVFVIVVFTWDNQL